MSDSTVELILINNVIPFLFLYGKMKSIPRYQDKALALLEKIAPESNSIIRKFGEFGIIPESASQSQALIELKTNYCDQKKCLECRIGLELIK
jgi:hypothetical protein